MGLSGSELADRASLQSEEFGAQLSTPAEVAELRSKGGCHTLRLAGGEEVVARAVLIATSAPYRTLDVDGCERPDGAGNYYAATRMQARRCRRAQVVVVGDGNSAGQAAVFPSEHASRLLLLLRADELALTMSRYLARRTEQTPNIEVRHHTDIVALHGDGAMAVQFIHQYLASD